MARDLKLEVMLRAIDKATGPLRKITQGSGKTAEALKASKDELDKLKRGQRDLGSFRKLKEATRENGEALAAAQEQLRGMREGLKRTDAPSRQFQENFLKARQKVERLTGKLEEQRRELGDVRGRLRNTGIETKDLGSAENRMAGQIREANERLEQQRTRLREVTRQQKRATEAANRYHRAIGRANNMTGAGVTGMAAGGAALYGGARLLAPGVDYGEQMSAVQAVGRFQKDDPRFQALKDQSRELGASTAFSATEVGSGQEFLLRAGMSAKAIKSSMQDVLNLAIANNTELGRTADIASNIAGTFKIDLEQEGAMGHVADVLSATASRANVDLEKLGETVKYLGGAEDLDLTLEQASAMAGLLGNIGIQGSQAGTTLRGMMNRLTEPTAEAAGVIDKLGVQVADAQGNMRDMPDILRDINAATQDLGSVARKSDLQKIFGAEAGSGMAELVSQMSTGALDDLIAKLQVAAGENDRMAKTMQDNIGGDLKALNSAWEEVGITITDTNEGPLRNLIRNVTEITRAVGNWMKENPELASTLATIAAVLAAVVAAGGTLTVMLASILGPIAAVRYALTLLSLNPAALTIMAIVAAVALLAAGTYLIYKNWDKISAWFGARWNDVKAAFDNGIGGITRLLADWSPIGLLYKAIVAGLEMLGVEVPAKFGTLGGAVIDGLIGGIGAGLGMLKEKVIGLGSSVMGWFKETLGINSPSRVFTGFGANLLEGLINGIDEKWQMLKDKIGSVAGGVMGWFKDKLGIHSPSRVFAGFGRNTLEGYRQGLAASESGPLKQVGAFGQRMKRAGAGLAIGAASLPAIADVPIDHRPSMESNQASSAPLIGELNINVHPAPGMDEQALARLVVGEVQRALAQAERAAGARRRSALYDTD
ncbi:phage tail tape measure protein, TP901 family, core region [Modicisalibacter muralis]|uniref:Phage tail tape measure protein, TP901 family, core region n=1 Tax=Modicisalibacter muralis TaxID=119000 RepID=A0A1G9EPZ9_9GAMM|nr:phage tail tape measure protein [Halomonas muralis]SDK78262.1 phage tail tape measure protein, TP901 family, core region [Halomonas muralis]